MHTGSECATKNSRVVADVAMVTMSLSGDAEAQRQLASRLLDTVHRVVTSAMPGEASDEIVTRVQEVFVALLERDAEDLREWDPDDGPTLEDAVAQLAERRIAAILAARASDGVEIPSNSATEWTPLTGAERRAVLAKILARLDQGETLAEDGSEIEVRDFEAKGVLHTTPDLPLPLPRPQVHDPWRPSGMHVVVTIGVAIAIAVAVAVSMG